MDNNNGLSINRPLLSVRRFSSSKKIENRKNESHINQTSSNQMMNSGSPARPKNDRNKQITLPMLFKPRNKIFKSECSKSTNKESSSSQNDCDGDDNVDTLSPSETSFNNCSTSGGVSETADPNVRDFMLGRFLPAARAMASDVPQHVSKKVAINDDYDSDSECHEHGPKSTKFCGLIPRFRSPVNGMCMGGKLPVSPANRTHASSSSSEPARSAVHKSRSFNSVLKIESNAPANMISVDLSGSIQSTVSEQSDSSSKKKGISFRELLADKKNITEITETETETDSQDSIMEKTLYVDTVRIAESPKQNSVPSRIKLQSSFNEPEHDMKTGKCKDIDAELELFDDVKGNQKLKGYDTRLFENPAPPPLPKSPSDSWLCRTLPSVSSKKAHTLWIPIYPASNTVANDPKTDENDQLQSPQEQMNPMPES